MDTVSFCCQRCVYDLSRFNPCTIPAVQMFVFVFINIIMYLYIDWLLGKLVSKLISAACFYLGGRACMIYKSSSRFNPGLSQPLT